MSCDECSPTFSHAFAATVFATAMLTACDLGTYAAGGGGGSGPAADGGIDRADAQFVSECSSCHGDEGSPAPPKDLTGNTDTSSRGVGAHRQHLDLSPTWHSKIACEDCHTVPATTDAPGHLDGDNVAELTWGSRATTRGASPAWNGTTCSNVYCHGATLTGGTLTEPTWTTVNNSQDACGNCHGAPPPAPHTDDTNCGACHPTIQPGTNNFLDPTRHINGIVEVTDGQACDACHGSDGNSAPPTDLAGNTARTSSGVGAHRQHLGTSSWRREILCSDCHVVPTETGDPGHMDGDNKAEVIFGTLNPTAAYDAGTTTCNNLYCHSDGWRTLGTANWTADVVMSCSSCHEDGNQRGRTMSGDHDEHIGEGIRCSSCHQTVVDRNKTIIAPGLHVNGQNEVSMERGGTYDPNTRLCSNIGCHGTERW